MPSAKKDLETVRSGVFAAPGLRRARTTFCMSTAESGIIKGSLFLGEINGAGFAFLVGLAIDFAAMLCRQPLQQRRGDE
jgi:hypothetical protein